MTPWTAERKDVALTALDIKAAEGGGWRFSGYASVFDVLDGGGDVVAKGAFQRTLRERPSRPLLWSHDMAEPIGKELALREDARGLYGEWRIVDTQRGADTYKLLKAGIVSGMSIGYRPVDADRDQQGNRLLRDVELYECSVVAMPMNEQATVTTVKYKSLVAEHLERLLHRRRLRLLAAMREQMRRRGVL